MSKQLGADILLLIIAAIWGASFTLMKNVLDHMPSFIYLSLRFWIAAVLLIIVFHKSFKHINRRVMWHGLVIGLMLFGGMALQVSGLYFTTASNSAFITGMNVVMVPAVSALLLKKRPNLFAVMGVFLSFAGLFFLSGGLQFNFNVGDLLTLICAFCFTFQIIFIDKYTAHEDAALIAVLQILFAAVFNTAVWAAAPTAFGLNATVVVTLLITGVFGTALAFAGQTIVQKYTSPTRTALILTAEPVFGALFALVIPNSQGITETLQTNVIIGCALIFSGMLMSEIKIGKNDEAQI